MPTIQIKVLGKYAQSPIEEIVCGNSDYNIEFLFSDEWHEHETKTARFLYANQSVDVIFNGNVVQVPIIRNTTVLEVGVFAGELSTTTPALVKCSKSILCKDGLPPDPAPNVYNQLLTTLTEINETVGDINTALDELHNYAQELVNGGNM